MRTLARTLLTSLFVLILSTAAFSQTPTLEEFGEYPSEWQEWISNSLEHDNAGVVESAIFHVAKFKMRHPERDTAGLETRVQELAEDGETDIIRYKAATVIRYLENPELYATITNKNYRDNSDEFFRVLTSGLQETYLSSN